MRTWVIGLLGLMIASQAVAQAATAPSNPVMAQIFAEDQADRAAGQSIDWARVGQRDAVRRAATRKLLADGALSAGTDFRAAAFVFQHGNEADDYLLAHTLAMIAVVKGDQSALWIATSTLDRYLIQIGRPQIYGTQYSRDVATRAWTQEPYKRDVVSDQLRKQLGVKTLAEQMNHLAGLPAKSISTPKVAP